MQKKNKILKNNKGIALITLVVAVLMMLVISSIIIFNTTSHLKINNLNSMYNDIRVLNEQVFLYYSKYNELPIISDEYKTGLNSYILGEYDSDKFHIVDIDKIDRNIKSNLNYGTDYYDKNYNGTNIYIINTITHQIFYVQGIKVDDTTYYTIPVENNIYQNISVDEIVANPPILENDLKPIIYDEQNGIIPVSNYDKSWYDYSEKSDLNKWARAEITDTEIYMWIPRYAYNTETNEIVFLKGITNNPIPEKDITGDEWLIPDAFQNKEKEQLTGIWIYLGEDYKKIKSKIDLIKAVYDLTGKDNTKGTTNTSITGAKYTYYNPVIPVGFKTLPTKDASWKSTNGIQVDGWNDGLVIEDEDGNQFVWVPVDGTNVTYDYHYSKGSTGNTSLEESLPTGISSEDTQITTYKGFYIARYEAGIPETLTSAISNTLARDTSGIPVSKKNQVPWNYISWSQAKANAESMYKLTNTNNHVQSTLITDRMWETTMQWLEKSSVDVQSDSTSWGNYRDAAVTGITEYSTNGGASWTKVSSTTKETSTSWLLKTGHTDYTSRKNIYDLAGNLWEWTNAKYSSSYSNSVIRGGRYYNDGTSGPAACRGGKSATGLRQYWFQGCAFCTVTLNADRYLRLKIIFFLLPFYQTLKLLLKISISSDINILIR